MEGLKPGRIVYFTFDEFTAKQVDESIAALKAGNHYRAGDVAPAMITRVWDQASGCVNLKVILDGPDSLWVTSVMFEGSTETKTPRTWHWMFDGQNTRYNPNQPK